MSSFAAALFGVAGGYSMFEIAKWVIILVAVIAIVYVVCRVVGVTIPQWLVQIIVIVAVAAVAIVALGFLVSL